MTFQMSACPEFAKSSDYGWCTIDRRGKKPTILRNNPLTGQKRKDYFLDSKRRQYTQEFFDLFGLPMPSDDMVYRGNSQDLLFLNDFGLVIRTGPTDIIDLIHPGVLQPLYWMPFDNNNHVIAIYPGIRVSQHLSGGKNDDFDTHRDKLTAFMKKTGQSTIDAKVDQNFGYIDDRIVVLDVENFFFGSKNIDITHHKRKSYNLYREAELPPHKSVRMVMSELYGHHPEFKKWIKSYDYHEPLRAQLDDAMNQVSDEARLEKLNLFYRRCRRLTQVQERILSHDWHVRGARNKQKIWVKEEPHYSEMALYHPWTGIPEDNNPKNSLIYEQKTVRCTLS